MVNLDSIDRRQNNWKLAFLSIWVVLASNSSASEAPAQVTLETAKRYAIDHNPEVLALRQEVQEKAAGASKARASFYPELGIAGGADYGQGGQAAVLGYAYASYNLFRGFKDTYRVQLADADSDISMIRLKQAEFNVGLEVEKYFHLYLFKKTALSLKKQALDLNQTHMKMAANRRASGLAANSDVMEFSLRERLLQSDIQLIGQEQEETRIRVRKLLGEEIGSKIEPVGQLQHRRIEGELMDYLKRLKDESATIRLASRELAKSSIESNQWKSNWLPQVDLQAEAGYLNLNDRPPAGGPGAKGMVVAKFPLFSGFLSVSERREGEARKLKSEALLKDAIQNTLTETEVSVRRLFSIQDRVEIEEQNEASAKAYYDAVVAEYRKGLKNSADVRVAAEGLFEARLRRENFKYEFLVQELELERAIGGPIETKIVVH